MHGLPEGSWHERLRAAIAHLIVYTPTTDPNHEMGRQVALVYNGTTGPSFLRGQNSTVALANGKLSAAVARYGSILSGITNATPGNFAPSSITQRAATIWAALF